MTQQCRRELSRLSAKGRGLVSSCYYSLITLLIKTSKCASKIKVKCRAFFNKNYSTQTNFTKMSLNAKLKLSD